MASLADRGIKPGVVDDQYGRLTFTAEITRAIRHLLDVNAPYGTYNVSNGGEPMTWATIARSVFEARGQDPAAVTSLTTAQYGAGKSLAPRPVHSALTLDKIRATGFQVTDAAAELRSYLANLG
jgi:dTDP-4-dehydrorhamnose 3,5-epimerase